MKKVVAVSIRDVGKGRKVTAFVGRAKNRRVAWQFKTATKDPKVIRQMVEDAEENRLRVEGTRARTPGIKGGSDGNLSG